jgi:hypothetical protein
VKDLAYPCRCGTLRCTGVSFCSDLELFRLLERRQQFRFNSEFSFGTDDLWIKLTHRLITNFVDETDRQKPWTPTYEVWKDKVVTFNVESVSVPDGMHLRPFHQRSAGQ